MGQERVERCQELGMRWEEEIWGVLSEEERYLWAKDQRMDMREQTSDHRYQLLGGVAGETDFVCITRKSTVETLGFLLYFFFVSRV